jgi:hypothetical protein
MFFGKTCKFENSSSCFPGVDATMAAIKVKMIEIEITIFFIEQYPFDCNYLKNYSARSRNIKKAGGMNTGRKLPF